MNEKQYKHKIMLNSIYGQLVASGDYAIDEKDRETLIKAYKEGRSHAVLPFDPDTQGTR